MPVAYSLTSQFRLTQDAWDNVIIEPGENNTLTSSKPSAKWSTLDQVFTEKISPQSGTTAHSDTSGSKSPIEGPKKAHQKNETISSLTKLVPNLTIEDVPLTHRWHKHSSAEKSNPFPQNAPEGWTAVWLGE